MIALDSAIGGTEKLKLVRELGSIRSNMPGVSGVNKLTLVKRVREIRQLLSIQDGTLAVNLSINPSNPVESLKSLTNHLRSDISRVPEALRVLRLIRHLKYTICCYQIIPVKNSSS
ncbi:MAG: hypothetical protein HRU78_04280 [Gammaproteobacteria bacterium]|nr:MAG: hypothetical protein HRU78_04280 [Gammaproteobacteria bacterium]